MYRKYIKRILDIIIAAVFVIMLIPIYIIMYIITKIEFKGSAIFKQRRIQNIDNALRRQHRWKHSIGRSESDARKDRFRYG